MEEERPVCDFWRPWKARSVEELAVHGLWETKEGPVCDFGRPWKASSVFRARETPRVVPQQTFHEKGGPYSMRVEHGTNATASVP